MERLNYSIKEEYSIEINKIGKILNDLKMKRIYELSNVKSDGGIEKKVDELEEQLNDLLTKIQNGNEGNQSSFSNWFK